MNIELYTVPFNIEVFKSKVDDILNPFNIDIQKLIKDHSLDSIKVNTYISKFNPNDREAIEYIISNIKHISWKEFKKNFIELAKDIKKSIKGDYGFFLPHETQYHSESFFTALVYKEVFSKWKDPVFCGYNNSITNNIIYVDDGSYSGTQLTDTLSDFIEKQKDIYSNSPTDFSVIILNRNVDLPVLKNDNEYFISINIPKNLYGLYTKSGNKKYTSDNKTGVLDFNLVLTLLKDLEIFREIHKEKGIVYIKENHRLTYINIHKLQLLMNKINIWICIPYISEEAFTKLYNLDKNNNKYFKIHFTDPFNHRLYNIIQEAPTDLKPKVIELLKRYLKYYSKYLSQTEIELKDIPILPIYFDHKISSIVSTLSVIIGCGVVLFKDDTDPIFVGPLVKNCQKLTDKEERKIEILIHNLYKSYTIHKDDTQTCSICPKPIYALREKEIKDML